MLSYGENMDDISRQFNTGVEQSTNKPTIGSCPLRTEEDRTEAEERLIHETIAGTTPLKRAKLLCLGLPCIDEILRMDHAATVKLHLVSVRLALVNQRISRLYRGPILAFQPVLGLVPTLVPNLGLNLESRRQQLNWTMVLKTTASQSIQKVKC